MWIDDVGMVGSRALSMKAIDPYLRVVRAWCASRSPSDGATRGYRSRTVERFAASVFPESCHSPFTPDMVRRLDELHERRRELLANEPARTTAVTADDGGLLLVNWRESLFDGACAAITHGFLDDDGMPGWDSWVRLASLDDARQTHGLVCWIPPRLMASVDDAIRLDAARCMTWLEADEEGLLSTAGWGKVRHGSRHHRS